MLAEGPIPVHIAFIMDGNRRFARKQNLKEGAGHKVGFFALLAVLKYCNELGVKFLTAYAFSIDNFKRRPEEVQYVMSLLEEKANEILNEEHILYQYGVRVRFIGNLKLLNEPTRIAAEKAMEATAKNDKIVLSICVAYSSTDEIVHAVQEVCNDKRSNIQTLALAADNTTNEIYVDAREGIDRDSTIKLADVERHMYLAGIPDPDILVRTSGETRLSNFLLWQTTHCFLHSPSVLWPSFTLWTLIWIILDYQRAQSYLDKKKKLI
ncbi:Isoprenyl transferase [Thalictrum thalictroides]|uniref:Alkyl transferase n=1 Tax=Thalictrum thalictroides TaxID=46969 RepID=A0A7J6XGZ1_THATH|nr:Isoprenyl transferase [Thalictrum thalictroides]